MSRRQSIKHHSTMLSSQDLRTSLPSRKREMASSSSNKFRHARSNSLPSRPHPVISQLEKDLHSLGAPETTCSISSLTGKLSGLQDLHECVNKLLLLPLVQNAFSQRNTDERWVDELLDGSLRLLDLYSTAKNSLSQTKEAVQELQSSMRRRKGGENVHADQIRKYLSTRKSVKKEMKKTISSLRSRKDESSSLLVKDDEAAAFVNILREVEEASSAVLESVLCLISGSRRPSSSSSWSIISKVMPKRIIASEVQRADLNELAKQDLALESLISGKISKVHDQMQVEQVQNSLKNLKIDIQDLEEGLDSLWRRLIKSRVSLLNILNN